MANPLSRVKPKAALSVVPPTAMSERPTLAVKVAEVISIWSAIESEILSIATDILDTDYVAVAAMLGALTSSEAKTAALVAAATEVLNRTDLALFNKVREATKASRNRRNEFAHHIWMYSDDLPDALLLIDPKYLSSFSAKRKRGIADLEQAMAQKRVMADGLKLFPIPEIDKSKIFVYRDKDLDTEVHYAQRAFKLHNQLRVWLKYDSLFGGSLSVAPRDQVLPELCELLQDQQ
ncbi:MAG: hypothetical protein ACYCZQ_15135 [Burkholderiales bacterium]